MNVKAVLVFVLVLVVVSFATESEAFTGRGGMIGKIQSQQEYKVSFKNNYLFVFLGVSLKVSLERGSCSYISLLLVAQIICCECSLFCKI